MQSPGINGGGFLRNEVPNITQSRNGVGGGYSLTSRKPGQWSTVKTRPVYPTQTVNICIYLRECEMQYYSQLFRMNFITIKCKKKYIYVHNKNYSLTNSET